MKRQSKTLLAAALACGLALSLLPLGALAEDSGSYADEIDAYWNLGDALLFPELGRCLPSEYDEAGYRLVGGENSEGGSTQAEYDGRGNLIRQVFTDGDGYTNTTAWTYDSQDRVTGRTEKVEGQETHYQSSVEYRYDEQGRLVREDHQSDGQTAAILYTYDSQGRLIEERVDDESGPSVDRYTYEGDTLVRMVSEGEDWRYENLSRYENGREVEKTTERSTLVSVSEGGEATYRLEETWTTVWVYDSQGRLTKTETDQYDGEGNLMYAEEDQMQYFQDGKLQHQLNAWESHWDNETPFLQSNEYTIRYDSAGRLSSVVRERTENGQNAGTRSYTYHYDEAGNNDQVVLRQTGEKDVTYSFTYEAIQASPSPAVQGFADVPEGAYYAAPVAWAVDKQVTTGTSSTTFSPDQPCTRAQVVTFLWRAMGRPEAQPHDGFTDVEAGSYYEQAVAWAVENQVTTGTSPATFSPDQPCTRAQVVTFLHRALGSPQVMLGTDLFTDVPEDAYFFQPVLWALDRSVTAGTGAGVFSPDAPCTRAQVVTFLSRALAQ